MRLVYEHLSKPERHVTIAAIAIPQYPKSPYAAVGEALFSYALRGATAKVPTRQAYEDPTIGSSGGSLLIQVEITYYFPVYADLIWSLECFLQFTRYKAEVLGRITWLLRAKPGSVIMQNKLTLIYGSLAERITDKRDNNTLILRSPAEDAQSIQIIPQIHIYRLKTEKELDLTAIYSAALQAFKTVAVQEDRKSRIMQD
ncbi:uncharacterized protein KY384_007310 [Bacidia gigantensis]|uniref:uncharacterized protein n=1 Tax=Bacidia gigantensis TaxID=2732470 RepID=UPI001D04DDEE|nr:uncharacterized protein KY384_007310 [Bacidia gigantensis]KAG8528392.1 hypothetical protein KY384_007310 [Bacidia gigantensis]